MTFKTYMKQFINADTPLGDLARDIKSDRDFPSTKDRRTIKLHLVNAGAYHGAMAIFNVAYDMYKADNN